MFLPEGSSQHTFVSTDLVNLEKLVDSFHQDLFTGWCEFRTEDTRTVLVLEYGRVQKAFRLGESTTALLLPDAALEECQSASGEVKWAMLPPEVVDMMIRLLFCELIRQDSNITFIDFKTLLRSLEEDSFTGHLEIKIKDDVHYISLNKGGPRAALYFSEKQLFEYARALERIFSDAESVNPSINMYVPKHVPMGTVFLKLSKDLLASYSDLKGSVLTLEFWKKLSSCAQDIPEIGVGELEFRLEPLPADIRRQEEIFVSLLQCQITLFEAELGEKTTQSLYLKLLEELDSPMKELFGIVVQNYE
jgi:hypothetical protein